MEIPRGNSFLPLEGGAIFHRLLELEAGDFLQVVVEQDGIDVELRLLDPSGGLVHRVDSPNGKRGPEELLAIAPASGLHRIEVEAAEGAAPGKIRWIEPAPRASTGVDREMIDADRAYFEGYRALRKDPQAAVGLLGRSLLFWQAHGYKAREAATLDALGIAYRRLEDFEAALVLNHRAAVLYGEAGDLDRRGYALDRAGYLRVRLGRAAQAVAELEEAHSLILASGNRDDARVCAGHLATAYRKLGQVDRALGLFEDSLGQLDPSERKYRASLLLDYGRALLTVNRTIDAYAAFDESRQIFGELGESANAAAALGAMADVAAFADLPDEGLQTSKMALAALGQQEDPRTRCRLMISRGGLETRLGKFAEARSSLNQAMRLAQESGDDLLRAGALLQLGYLDLQDGKAGDSLVSFEGSRSIFGAAKSFEDLASSEARSAQALMALGRLSEARERILLALAAVEQLREDSRRRDVRMSYFGFRQEYFDIAVEILMELDRQRPGRAFAREALAMHEKRLALELRTRLARGSAIAPGADPLLREKEAALEQDLTRSLSGERGPGAKESEAEVRRLLDSLQEVWDAMAGPSSAPALPVAVEELQGLIDGQSIVLTYSLGKKQSFLFGITPEKVVHARLPPRAELEEKARAFRSSVETASSSPAGRELTRALLEPLASELAGKRLVLVLDGELENIAFAALPRLGDRQGYLVEDHEIVSLPSLTSLAQLQRAAAAGPAAGKGIAVIADPVFSPRDPRFRVSPRPPAEGGFATDPAVGLRRLGDRLGADYLARLPGSRVEATAILDRLSPADRFAFFDFEAGREALLGLPKGNYRLLHVATHAVAIPENPDLSGLVLSMVGADGQPRDGFVRAYEIRQMDLPLELVNLSACGTGKGPSIRGEGTLAISRAFLEAGARRVIASLWSVGDKSTARLMTLFYDGYLGRGLPASAALREAQRAMLADPAARPVDWAAFVFQGIWQGEIR